MRQMAMTQSRKCLIVGCKSKKTREQGRGYYVCETHDGDTQVKEVIVKRLRQGKRCTLISCISV